jgi:hypothetical protein
MDPGTLTLDELMAEIRARAGQPSIDRERGVAIYAKVRDELKGLATFALIERARAHQKDLYLSDLRFDLDEIAEPAVRAAAERVAMLVDDKRLKQEADGTCRLLGETLGKKRRLCEGERFIEQPSIGFGTAVLVAPDIVATAAHCLKGARRQDKEARLAEMSVVFGANRAALAAIPDARVLGGIELLDYSIPEDWALIRLEQPVAGITPAPLRRDGKIADDAPVQIIGHPCGLPTKYAPGATVRANQDKVFFRANLDAFGGNSGSPVFGADWTVEGLLVSGAGDFVRDGPCWRAMVIPIRDRRDGPLGEDCVRASLFASKVPRG